MKITILKITVLKIKKPQGGFYKVLIIILLIFN